MPPLQVTANLVRKKIGVDMRYLHALAFGTILDLAGTKVTFIDANQSVFDSANLLT